MTRAQTNVVQRLVADLRPRPQNARTHSRKQIRKIADSIERFGFVAPVLIEPDGKIIAGHGRVDAAKLLGMPAVPTITVIHLSSEEARAYVIADNKLATLAGWDRELLAVEIAELQEVFPDMDLTVMGFEIEEIAILQDVAGSKIGVAPEPALSSIDRTVPAVTETGDVWLIGSHKLLCGDALDPACYLALLGKERADLVVTDPPYNVPIAGHVSGLGVHREFAMASGEMSRVQFQRFLNQVCANLTRFSRSGSLHYVFMDWRSIADLVNVGEAHFETLLNIIVWVKSNAGLGSLYRSQHELVALFKHGKRAHKNNVQLGANGRYRTNVWNYAGANSFGPERAQNLADHPTVKNLEMITEAIRDASDQADLVLDPFAGSGTTLLATERCGREARLIELDEQYCDGIVRRAANCGLGAKLFSTGETFDQLKVRREAERHGDASAPHSASAS